MTLSESELQIISQADTSIPRDQMNETALFVLDSIGTNMEERLIGVSPDTMIQNAAEAMAAQWMGMLDPNLPQPEIADTLMQYRMYLRPGHTPHTRTATPREIKFAELVVHARELFDKHFHNRQ